MPKYMKIGAVLIAVAIIGFVPYGKIYDDGLWPLSVTIHSASGKRIVAANGQAFGHAESAEYVMAHLAPPETMLFADEQKPYRGEPLKVPIPANETIRVALLWNYRSFYQFKKLVVIVRYDDGKEEGRLVDIPNLHQSREVHVDFP